MRLSFSVTGCILLSALALLAAGPIPGDAQRGKQVFQDQKCVNCHSLKGQGGTSAPDLSRALGREYSPMSLAATIWNHGPAMFSAIEKAGAGPSRLSPNDAADLFSFFYANRFFERPGDAGRGKQLFVSKGCQSCHGGTTAGPMKAAPVSEWQSISDPIELARRMWNHSTQMRIAMQKQGNKPPTLTAAEMNDIIIYVQNLPGSKAKETTFAPASAETGETLFQLKGCAECHRGKDSLFASGGFRGASELSAAMWNHSNKMLQMAPDLRPEEMTRLVGYLFALQFAKESGDAARGEKVFSAKGCASCHTGGPGPAIRGKADASPFYLISAVFSHGSAMEKQIRAKGGSWPRFDQKETADLLSYLRGK